MCLADSVIYTSCTCQHTIEDTLRPCEDSKTKKCQHRVGVIYQEDRMCDDCRSKFTKVYEEMKLQKDKNPDSSAKPVEVKVVGVEGWVEKKEEGMGREKWLWRSGVHLKSWKETGHSLPPEP
jgi:hypothetical protein